MLQVPLFDVKRQDEVGKGDRHWKLRTNKKGSTKEDKNFRKKNQNLFAK